ncbi:MAG: Asp-tRNA(Asn)/Glu-tRNA(Gln) amidotransferase GatCAB subunit A [Rhodovulum sulfidophilum]|uniref:Asp-tRNA(Asn)/Glu-tRNA(Gln) amidotransferase GatCAB subunit A n=1 Tax=Rhodovulum sulfidophilum TaxID=35806 RepID=A0A2W5N9J4_RHOSU|nr:MAG: Asp-tRNA(Asn)/Glu-tRNA(Gln) amidotransferase GatCAB subunit A [Rhodovulum sulfidophilum]
MDDIHYLGLLELTAKMHAGELSPVEVTRAQLARIEALDGDLRSFATLTPELALEQAATAEAEIARGEIRGPLHGAPIALKDLCWTKGIPTAGGMTIHSDFIPDEDGTVTRKLAEAGTILLGKLQLTESAFADHHPKIPAPVNPWNEAHWSGASSSGSGVATAAGLCFGALGTDTGGSIRFPSAANGLTGLKPTWGRVSRHGVFELAATLDHVGPMARSAADAAALLAAIAGPDAKDPTAAQTPVPDYLGGIGGGLAGLRVGIDADYNAGVDAVTAAALAQVVAAVEALGGEFVEVTVPDSARMVADWVPACAVETAVVHEATYPARKDEYGPSLAALIETGRALSGMDYQKIILRRYDFRGRVAALFRGIDLLLIPAQGAASPTVARMESFGEDADLFGAMLRYTCVYDLSGNPTITLPCGFTEQGTPLAFQFVANHWDEAKLFRAGHAFQQATDWHRRHPAL